MEKEYLYNNYAPVTGSPNISKGVMLSRNTLLSKKFNDPDFAYMIPANNEVIKPNQNTTLIEPANSGEKVLILSPNIPGGMKVDSPSPVNVIGSSILSGGLTDLKNVPINEIGISLPVTKPKVETILTPETGTTKNALAFGLSQNYLIMGGMLVAVVLMFLFAGKSK